MPLNRKKGCFGGKKAWIRGIVGCSPPKRRSLGRRIQPSRSPRGSGWPQLRPGQQWGFRWNRDRGPAGCLGTGSSLAVGGSRRQSQTRSLPGPPDELVQARAGRAGARWDWPFSNVCGLCAPWAPGLATPLWNIPVSQCWLEYPSQWGHFLRRCKLSKFDIFHLHYNFEVEKEDENCFVRCLFLFWKCAIGLFLLATWP